MDRNQASIPPIREGDMTISDLNDGHFPASDISRGLNVLRATLVPPRHALFRRRGRLVPALLKVNA